MWRRLQSDDSLLSIRSGRASLQVLQMRLYGPHIYVTDDVASYRGLQTTIHKQDAVHPVHPANCDAMQTLIDGHC